MVMKAFSTLTAVFAEVSRNSILRLSANSGGEGMARIGVGGGFSMFTRRLRYAGYPLPSRLLLGSPLPCSVVTTLFGAARSILLPTRSLLTDSQAYLSISWSHCLTLLNDSASVTS